ncbi:SpoIIE family protein phosphatase [Actinorugispora endophytica]|uniref:Serine phosphatase RsbU (Regulator of sigma subunit) n=1 Tax=Actinorugispora endophytica TaxID=1605990 RepID=A0A4R6UWI3_9ACTN|nr:SpoIIE family protein phosphatase [Actinorugispora endophytica]TDQ50253.1 serine phosphatase RsbU (regulator of sigma subunit) [Actinorugispora endophytica]
MEIPQSPNAEGPVRGDTERLASVVDRLHRRLRAEAADRDARAVVELAKGVLMERLRCGPAAAARQLEQLAGAARSSVPELAADIVDRTADDLISRSSRHPGTVNGAAGPSDAVRLRTAESGLLAASDAHAAARSLLANALAPLGATALAVWELTRDDCLTLAGHAGVSPAEAARWRHVPPGLPTLARRALRERRPVWSTPSDPDSAPSFRAPGGSGGRCVLPAEANGRVLGVLEVCWEPAPDALPPRTHRQLPALAELCAHTLGGAAARGADPAGLPDGAAAPLTDLADSLLDPAMVLRPRRAGDGRITDFRIEHVNGRFTDLAGRPATALTGTLLLESYPMAGTEAGLFERIEHVHATGAAFHTDSMELATLVDGIPVSATAAVGVGRHGDLLLLTWRVHEEAERLTTLLQHAQRLGRIGGFEEDLTTGDVVWNIQLFDLYGMPPGARPIPLDRLAAHVHPDDAAAVRGFARTVLHHRRPASTAFRLRRPDGVVRHIRVVAEPVVDPAARLVAVRGAYQDVSAQHWTELALAVTRDRLADSEQRADEGDRLALRLQQAIMPEAPPPVGASGLGVAVRYRPAEKEHLVGGDWYDTVVLPGGRVLLVVGDVAGHGIEAATGMVALRNALRGLATTGAGPGRLLSWLNTVATHLTDRVTATAVCGVYDPGSRTLRWARAGHLPPVLVRGGSAVTLPLLEGILLGAAPDAEYEEESRTLEPGDVLLMYTDGLIERRDRSLEQSLDGLLAIARYPVGHLEERLDHLLTHSSSDTDDDTCLIGVQVN